MKSGYVAVFCFISTFIILYKHFKDLEPLEEIVGDVPSWWSLSPLWSQDGLLHVNPHPYRYHCLQHLLMSQKGPVGGQGMLDFVEDLSLDVVSH